MKWRTQAFKLPLHARQCLPNVVDGSVLLLLDGSRIGHGWPPWKLQASSFPSSQIRFPITIIQLMCVLALFDLLCLWSNQNLKKILAQSRVRRGEDFGSKVAKTVSLWREKEFGFSRWEREKRKCFTYIFISFSKNKIKYTKSKKQNAFSITSLLLFTSHLYTLSHITLIKWHVVKSHHSKWQLIWRMMWLIDAWCDLRVALGFKIRMRSQSHSGSGSLIPN